MGTRRRRYAEEDGDRVKGTAKSSRRQPLIPQKARNGRKAVKPWQLVVMFAVLLISFTVWRRTLGRNIRVPVLKHDEVVCIRGCKVS